MEKPVDVLIITAALGEDDAVREVEDGGLGPWEETPGPEGYAIKQSLYRIDLRFFTSAV